MSYDIQISDLTNSTKVADGNGVYDLLSLAVVRQIEDQYQAGRLSGTDFASVFLGSIQSVLAESVRFVLSEKSSSEQAALLAEQVKSEIKNNEPDGVIDKQKLKIIEDIDSSQKENTRRNLLNAVEIAHREKETILVTAQEYELGLNGVAERNLSVAKKSSIESGALDSTNKTNADISLIGIQKTKVAAEKTLVDSQNAEIGPNGLSQREVNTSNVAKLASEKILLDSRNAGTLAETIRSDAESAERVLLMRAQTIGFKTDAKQKLMRQLYEGYAVNVTTAGEVTQSPNGSTAAALDSIANDILDDLSSIVNISTEYEVVTP